MRITYLILIIGILASCQESIKGDGNVINDSRQISDFHSIKISGAFDVELVTGPASVDVRSDQNLLEHIVTEVSDGVLHIHSNNKTLKATELLVIVHFNQLEAVTIAGAAKVESKNVISGQRLLMQVDGAAECDVQVDVDELNVEVNGGAEMKIAGNARTTNLSINGAGEFKGVDLQCWDAVVKVNGAGEVELQVEHLLDASITGAGEVKYKGSPEVRKNITGVGSIEQI